MANPGLDKILGIKRFDYRECLGIYISLKDVYVAEIIEKSGGIEVDSLIKLPVGELTGALLKPAELNEGFFASPSYWLDPIKKIIASKKWNTKNVVVSLSPNFSIHRHFAMQDMQRKYWKQAIPLQARKYIHYPFERGVYDYHVYSFFAGLSKTKRLGVVFSLTSSKIVSTIESGLKSIGLNLVAVETSPMSVYRLFNQTDKESIPGKGIIYSNFTTHLGQFLFALNNAPVLLREVEVQKALGTRNRLEVNNCVDFVSKQLERNPFEDTVIVSDDADFWSPILEGEVKRHVRKWKISDIFGFPIEGFSEMTPIGACLKFLNNKVADIDLFRKNRSTDEEIRGTITLWKVTAIALSLFFLWTVYVQVSSIFSKASLSGRIETTRERVSDFKGLSASQIRQRVKDISANSKALSALMHPVSYTAKLNSLPELLPAEMWLTRLDIRYPFVMKVLREKNSLTFDGVAAAPGGRTDELDLGKKFSMAMSSDSAMADLCKDQARIDYDFADAAAASSSQRQKTAGVKGTKFVLKCEKDLK